jgi:hypothetical protein
MKCSICGADGFKNKAGFLGHRIHCARKMEFIRLVTEVLDGGLLVCELGCGRPARFLLKTGKVACERLAQCCVEVRRKNGDAHRGKCHQWKNGKGMLGKHNGRVGKSNVDFFGEEKAREISRKISCALVGKVRVALTPEKEDARRKKISEYARSNNYGGYKQGAGRGRHGWYKRIWCDSSWELAWVIYHLDHGIPFKRNRDRFEYEWQGETHRYLPDFKMPDGTYIEIKAWLDDRGRAKLAACPGVKVLMKKDIEPFLQYVVRVYGRDFVKMYDGHRENKCACGKNLGMQNRSGCCFKCGMKKRRHVDRFCSCGRILSQGSESGMCKKCVGIGRGRKAVRPEMSILSSQVEEMGFKATGRIYGVSDNAVRKWLK